VDIGVKQDGLVHISQLSNTYVSDPNSVVKLQQQVMVTVLEVDVARKRISLSMKGAAKPAGAAKASGGTKPAGGAKPAGGKPAGAKIAPGPATVKQAPQEEGPDAFQAKLMALKKKFK